jgi:hypothetical protein
MQKFTKAPASTVGARLPDPAKQGPYRPFTSDPGQSEAWWWLGLPLLVLLLLIGVWHFKPHFFADWILPEGYGVLEFSQFATILAALVLSV